MRFIRKQYGVQATVLDGDSEPRFVNVRRIRQQVIHTEDVNVVIARRDFGWLPMRRDEQRQRRRLVLASGA